MRRRQSTVFADPFKKGFTRRRVMQGTTAIAAGLAVQPLTARYAFAAPAAGPVSRVLINVIWRGGADQHTLFPLLGVPQYAQARPNLRETAQTAFQLNAQVGALNEWRPLYDTLGAAGFGYVPAAVSQDRTHSHFDATDVLEGGLNGPSSDGWAARGAAQPAQPGRAVRGDGRRPASRSRWPARGALTLDRLESFGLAGGDEVKAKSEAVLQKFYSQYKDPVATTSLQTLNAIKTIRNLGQREYQPAAQYPGNGLANAFRTAAQLIKARVGLRFVTIDMGGWDTHTNSRPQLHDHATEASGAMNAFFQDLGAALRPFVTVVTSTEFGRNCRENGSPGHRPRPRHGHAGARRRLDRRRARRCPTSRPRCRPTRRGARSTTGTC